jgi:4'-phosphopantetheinyl transferase
MPIVTINPQFIKIKELKTPLSQVPCLNSSDIIIYTIYLPLFIDALPDLVFFLSPEERNRSERFHHKKDQNQFAICRSLLKLVLAAQTKVAIKDICIEYHLNKKPYLASHPWLHFNVSHSEDHAIIALSHREVGIDIESIPQNLDLDNLLPDIFTKNEILEIENAEDKKKAFYLLWTRKEALVKALGKGIDDDFKHSPSLDGQHNIDSIAFKTVKNWQIQSFDLTNHYLGAIAFESATPSPQNLTILSLPNTIKQLMTFATPKK